MLKRMFRFLAKRSAQPEPFKSSEDYWQSRYAAGGNSGVGSYDKFAAFKADVINSFVETNKINSIIEFGCGDGNQLTLANYPNYIGFDVSNVVIDQCREKFLNDDSKLFQTMNDYKGESADLTLSLDVIYHLVEDETFDQYMQHLFDAANRYVIVYSSNFEDIERKDGEHIKHRVFENWVRSSAPDWELKQHIPNKYPYKGNYKTGSFADFYIYCKTPNES